DNLFDTIGWWFLNIDKFKMFFAWLLEIPFVGFTRFNNTIVMGSLLASLALYIPVYILVRIFLKYWRAFIAPAVRKTKLVVFLSKLPLIVKIGEMA
nr:TIGR03546 family protein [Treponema sp.]